ncbi:hypothetical protein KY284_035599 [Solanum tuberosum]|nr:hypothetical protein KY284_035599 [Solanum tuberosum]
MELEEFKKEKYVESDRPPFSIQQQQDPWLVMCDGDVRQKQTFFSVSQNQYYIRRIPELKEKIIRANAVEWLVLQSIYSTDCYLWNLISNDKIQLPPLPECTILECLLSAPPNDPECHVLFLIEETETIPDDDDENSNDDTDDENDEDVNPPTFYFCKPGYNEEFHKEDGHSIFENGSGGIWTVFKKKFYVSTFQTRRLLCLEPDNDSGTITITPMYNESPDVRKYLDMGRFANFILQSCDDTLLYVHMFFNGKNHGIPYDFVVFRFDFARKRWIETESIGEIAIFISYYTMTGTICSTRGTNLNKESIYFIEGRYLYVYNLITHSISLSLPCPHVSKKNPSTHWLPLPCRKKQ